jgi:hypothetical protein
MEHGRRCLGPRLEAEIVSRTGHSLPVEADAVSTTV